MFGLIKRMSKHIKYIMLFSIERLIDMDRDLGYPQVYPEKGRVSLSMAMQTYERRDP